MVLIKPNETNPGALYRRRGERLYMLVYVARLTKKYAKTSVLDKTNNHKKNEL
jgi:hypothetical protein